jgi:signal transduction histidine kinase
MVTVAKTMNEQLKGILNKAKLNFVVLGCILMIAVVGKVVAPELTNTIFNTADQLVSELYLIFVAISLGAFIPNFKYVAAGSIGIFIAAVLLIHFGVFTYLTTEYLFSVLLVVLGFSAIANLYRHYREFKL